MLPVVGYNPLPDEKGTESCGSRSSSLRSDDVTILYPMKRGLKALPTIDLQSLHFRYNPLPDEKGTERLERRSGQSPC